MEAVNPGSKISLPNRAAARSTRKKTIALLAISFFFACSFAQTDKPASSKDRPASEQAQKRAGRNAQLVGSSIRVKTFTSPQNRFAVEIPADWEFQAYAPDESSVGFHPPGRETPKVDIALTEASILALQMGLQAFGYQPARSPIAAKDFLHGVLLPALGQKMPDLMIESLASSDQSTAESVISGTYEGKRGRAKIVAMMEHLQDPSVGSWYNFALLHVVTTAPAETDDPSVDVIASGIFRSFKPTSRWGAEMFQAIAQGIQTRFGIISRTISRINAMEMRQRMAEMESNTKIGQGWMDALGGTAVVTNPSSGDAWRVSNENKYYYEQAGRVYGTDDAADLNIVGRTPLEQR